MSKLDYELYFMSGLPIDLSDKKLGVIHQPKVRDFILNKMDIPYFSHPFLFDKSMLLNKKDSIDDLINGLGKLSFLIIYNDITSIDNEKEGVLDLLVQALKILYKTDDVMAMKTISKIVIDGKIIIGDEELEFLSELVVEMLRIDKEDMLKKIEDKNKQDVQDALMNEFDRRAKAYSEKNGKNKKEFTIMDMVNVIVHSQGVIDYSRAFDMTVYQLRNSYETLIRKEMFSINLMHRISPNFKPSDELKLWEEDVNIVRSNLSLKN